LPEDALFRGIVWAFAPASVRGGMLFNQVGRAAARAMVPGSDECQASDPISILLRGIGYDDIYVFPGRLPPWLRTPHDSSCP